MLKKCLSCSGQLHQIEEQKIGFHKSCCELFFGTSTPPILDLNWNEINNLAKETAKTQISIAGVQPKLSLNLISENNTVNRLTIIKNKGLWGDYILKPPVRIYPQLPENEQLTMTLAETAGLRVVPHTLIRMQSGELCYLTRRIDRHYQNQWKVGMEDFCQLSNRPTAQKYFGSHEQLGKLILKYSDLPLDLIEYFEIVVFNYLIGNSDAHLKNFSIHGPLNNQYRLAPSYDLVNSKIVIADEDDLALTINGKKRHLRQKDFIIAMQSFDLLNKNNIDAIIDKFKSYLPTWQNLIETSFLSEENKEKYFEFIERRFINWKL